MHYKKYIITLFCLLYGTLSFSQTVTLNSLGNVSVSGIPIEVEHYVNYVPNHSISSVPYNPLSTAGTSVGLSDDSNVGPFNIGFNFEFYGQTFSQFRICTNGFITFGDQSGSYTPGTFPNAQSPNGVIAAYWTDLFPTSGYYMNYQTVGTAPNRQLIVSAHLTYYSNRNAWVDYQIVLFENTNKVQTTIISQGWTPAATQGVENHTGTLAATPTGRNMSAFNGAGTTYEYTPMAAVQQWETQGTKTTNSTGQASWTNTNNWQYKVTIDTRNSPHTITGDDLSYLSYKVLFPSSLNSWDFYTCDCNGDNIIQFIDLQECARQKQNNTSQDKFVFSNSEKITIESNPTINYITTYPPTQLRTFTNENTFYIIGRPVSPIINPTKTNPLK